jgi:hypothetical protein
MEKNFKEIIKNKNVFPMSFQLIAVSKIKKTKTGSKVAICAIRQTSVLRLDGFSKKMNILFPMKKNEK